MLGYFGDREVEQFLANPSDAITGSGGVVDLDRKFGGTGLRWNHAGTLAGAPYEFTLGAEYDRMKERRRGYVNVLGERGELRRDEDDLVYSFDQYLIGSWKPTERWQIAGGLRRSEVHFESTDYFIVDIIEAIPTTAEAANLRVPSPSQDSCFKRRPRSVSLPPSVRGSKRRRFRSSPIDLMAHRG